jgi:hypothetical protein
VAQPPPRAAATGRQRSVLPSSGGGAMARLVVTATRSASRSPHEPLAHPSGSGFVGSCLRLPPGVYITFLSYSGTGCKHQQESQGPPLSLALF